MRKRIVLIATLMTMTLAGCSASAPADNSAELENLKAQAEELKKENEGLKAQLETAVEETTVAETAQTSTGESIQIGETGTLGDWSVTVTAAQTVDSIPDGYGAFTPDGGNKYFVVSLSIANNGKEADTFLPSFGMGDDVQAKILYDDGYEFSATQLFGYSKGLHDQSLNPLSTKEGDIAFEIPESITASTDELILQFKSGNSDLNIKVR